MNLSSVRFISLGGILGVAGADISDHTGVISECTILQPCINCKEMWLAEDESTLKTDVLLLQGKQQNLVSEAVS